MPVGRPSENEAISYEEAIGEYAHPGESIIARELREQREKEEELRKRWKDMGMDAPQAFMDNETPFTIPEPKVQRKHSSGPVAQRQSKTYAAAEPVGKRQSSVESDMSNQSSGSTDQRSVPTVQPWVDEDDTDSTNRRRSYIPSKETPMEREIRLLKEREEELRVQRGLPPMKKEFDDSVAEVQPSHSAPVRPQQIYRKGDVEDRGGQMKRLATSRLHQEIEQEKKREQDLRRMGKIRTTSEDRIGEPMKFIEIKESPVPSSPITPKSPKTSFSKPLSVTSPTSPQPEVKEQKAAEPPQNIPPPEVTAFAAPPSPQSAPVQNGGVDNAPAPQKSSQEPVMRRKPATSNPAPATFNIRKSQFPAESRIEMELREMREREEELRKQRDRVSGRKSTAPEMSPPDVPSNPATNQSAPLKQPTNQSAPFNGDAQNGSEVTVRPKRNSSSDMAGKRKSALAEEWERKFGGDS